MRERLKRLPWFRVLIEVAIVLWLFGICWLGAILWQDHQLTRASAANWQAVVTQQQQRQAPPEPTSTTSTTLPKKGP